jgi:hypothetical protein
MPPTRVDLHVVRPVESVDRAVATGDRAELRLGLPQPHLVAPVEALLVRTVGRLEPELPADVGDLGIRKVRHELAQGVRRPGGVRIGERDDVARRLSHGTILGGDLAAALAVDQVHPRLSRRDGCHQGVRAIRRCVRRDDDLQSVGWIVEREQVVEPPLDHRLLVVRGNDHRHSRLGTRILSHRVGTHPCS